MNAEYLVEMANRIGQFFEAYPDQEEAKQEIAGHLKRFWEPRMRRTLLAHVDTAAGAGLKSLVSAAIREHRETLEPK
ncbi:MAG: formate dehydrogenase subunit delta [Burkholderiaceae bacterium]|jgi:formate dehydrogenase subunit delta